MRRPKPSPKEPWHPSAHDKADALAFKALKAGNPSEQQCQRALQWLINTCCGMDDLSFRPDSPRATDFAEGKRFVGLQVWKLINIDMSIYDEKRKPNG